MNVSAANSLAVAVAFAVDGSTGVGHLDGHRVGHEPHEPP